MRNKREWRTGQLKEVGSDVTALQTHPVTGRGPMSISGTGPIALSLIRHCLWKRDDQLGEASSFSAKDRTLTADSPGSS